MIFFVFITYYFMSCCQKLKQSAETDQKIDYPNYHEKYTKKRKMNSLKKKEYDVLYRKSEIKKKMI